MAFLQYRQKVVIAKKNAIFYFTKEANKRFKVPGIVATLKVK